MSANLYETVANQYSGKAFRFHMPGHGGINFDSKVFASAPCDITELPFSDNLHNPQSVILDAEKKYSEIYNAKFCQFSTAGATAVLQTAISALKKSSKKMLLQYNSHKSIINACMMFNINFDFFYDLTDLKTKNFSDYSTAIFTSPDYLGRVFENYNEAYKLLKKNNIEIILDQAHGSHFLYYSKLKKFFYTADIVIISPHKTMSVLTGGAALLGYNENLKNKIFECFTMIHTTSPSYPILASLDYAREIFSIHGEQMLSVVEKNVENFKSSLNENYWTEETDDFTKIILNSKFDENEIYEKLISENIYPEGKIGNTILFIANFWNSDNLQRLAKYLNSLILPLKKEESYEFLKAKNKRTFSAQKDCPFELIDAKNCLGRKLAISIGRYPPGVLEIFQGEIIDKERQIFIIKNKQNLLGIINGKVGVVKDE